MAGVLFTLNTVEWATRVQPIMIAVKRAEKIVFMGFVFFMVGLFVENEFVKPAKLTYPLVTFLSLLKECTLVIMVKYRFIY